MPASDAAGVLEERTAAYNRTRGLRAEFGVVLPLGPERLRKEITAHLDTLPGWAKRCIGDLLEHAGHIEDRLADYDRAISENARGDERSRRLMQLRGIGPTTASALLASLGAGYDFKNGRQVAAEAVWKLNFCRRWQDCQPGRSSLIHQVQVDRTSQAQISPSGPQFPAIFMAFIVRSTPSMLMTRLMLYANT